MASSSVVRVDLKPNRSLLDPAFEGYKLSLDALPTFPCSLPSPVALVGCSDDQFSYIHAQLFGQANCVVRAADGTVAVINAEDGAVYRVDRDADGRAPAVVPVWTPPAGIRERQSGDYNPSLAFASSSLAVYTDGRGTLFILQVVAVGEWKTLFYDAICGRDRAFRVAAAAQVAAEDAGAEDAAAAGAGGKNLHCLFQYVQEKSAVEGLDCDDAAAKKVNFVNVVEWMTFAEEPAADAIAAAAASWRLDRARRFAFFGGIDFLSFNAAASAVVCATDKRFKVVFDSVGLPDDAADPAAAAADAPPTVTEQPPEKPPKFFWMQGVEDMVVWLMVGGTTTKRDIAVTLRPRELRVVVGGETRLGGPLWNVLDSDSMTWTIVDGKLEITAAKAHEGLMWQRFLAGSAAADDEDGEEVLNPEMVDEIHQRFAKLSTDNPMDPDRGLPSYNSQELEPCDALPEEQLSLWVISGSSNAASHRAELRGQWLFSVGAMTAGGRPAFCLRHDVDGLVWTHGGGGADEQSSSDDGCFTHVGTFSALGYVQASKQQRTYTIAAPDLSYAAICDRNKHVYVYRQPSDLVGADLRNRKSGQRVKQIAKQQVVTLDSAEDITGAVAANETLYIATKTQMICVKMK